VRGTIKDPNSAVIPGAAVTLTNVDTNISPQTATNGEGFYRFDAVDSGTYKISVTAPGFGTVERTGIAVAANQTAAVDIDLKVGGVESSVSVVEARGVMLQTETPVRGGNIAELQITQLPIAGRNPVALALTRSRFVSEAEQRQLRRRRACDPVSTEDFVLIYELANL